MAAADPAVDRGASIPIESRAGFDQIRYANCWEDAAVLCEALQPRPGMRILSIASAGDNALALAAEGAEVVAVDLSMAQLACLELRRAAIRELEHEELLAFLGVRPAADRLSTYARLAASLPPESRAFWAERLGLVAAGVIHAGRFENYFRLFRTRILPLIHTRARVEALLAARSAGEREAFYGEAWDNLRWRLLFRLFFSRFVMGRLGRDPEFFRFVRGSVAERILARARYAVTALPPAENPFLQFILRGNFAPSLPRYLEPERFRAVREGVERLTCVRGAIEDVAAAWAGGGYDGFNLSDIFEYMGPPLCREVYGRLLSLARPGARIAYWNMLAPRQCPPELVARVRSVGDVASALFRRDRAFFYSAFVLEEAC